MEDRFVMEDRHSDSDSMLTTSCTRAIASNGLGDACHIHTPI
jgi:hypothetical protein